MHVCMCKSRARRGQRSVHCTEAVIEGLTFAVENKSSAFVRWGRTMFCNQNFAYTVELSCNVIERLNKLYC
jgi:hypothetical protein